ncbi:MAG: RluA family pseudouridine synthase [Planctomycetaceae bacterium]|nr:RluA family pseudouridine synthase [Planctomycetaceae bacterium]
MRTSKDPGKSRVSQETNQIDTDLTPDIAYADEHLIVVNKPTGLLSVPGRTPDKQDCLFTRLRQAYDTLYVVHRLDRDTSGAMLFARNCETQSAFGRMFQQGEVAKEYCAWVEGSVSTSSGTLNAPIGRVPGAKLPPRYCIDHNTGRSAQTAWSVVATDHHRTRLSLKPVTGRSHQLRVHCQHMGHPIVGDPIYGMPDFRMFLHAKRLDFVHPASGDMLSVEVPVPF